MQGKGSRMKKKDCSLGIATIPYFRLPSMHQPDTIAPVMISNMYVLCIVVDENGRYLLIKESKKGCENTWSFPAGKIEKNENIIQAALRETREESGISIKPQGIFCIDHIPEDNWLRFSLLAKPVGGKLKTEKNHHSQEAGWFSSDQVYDLKLREITIKEFITRHKKGEFSLLPLESYRVYAR